MGSGCSKPPPPPTKYVIRIIADMEGMVNTIETKSIAIQQSGCHQISEDFLELGHKSCLSKRVGDGFDTLTLFEENIVRKMAAGRSTPCFSRSGPPTHIWDWMLSLPAKTKGIEGHDEDHFFVEDFYCKDGKHERRNPDKPNEPHTCCVFLGLKHLVTRWREKQVELEPYFEKLIPRAEGLGWNLSTISQSIIAVFVATFEFLQPYDNVQSVSRSCTVITEMNRVLRTYFDASKTLNDSDTATRDAWLPIMKPYVSLLQKFLLDFFDPWYGVAYKATYHQAGGLFHFGTYVPWLGFGLFTQSFEIAQAVARELETHGTILLAHVSSGRDVAHFCHNPAHQEILVPAFTGYFTTVSLDQAPLVSSFVSLTELHMQSQEMDRLALGRQIMISLRESKCVYEQVVKDCVIPEVAFVEYPQDGDYTPLLTVDSEKGPKGAVDIFLESTRNVLLITGESGMGKTMTSLRILAEVFQRHTQHIPVYINLADLLVDVKQVSFMDYLECVTGLTAREMVREKVVVVCDALDDIIIQPKLWISKGKSLTEWLQFDQHCLPKGKLIICCRKEFLQAHRISIRSIHDIHDISVLFVHGLSPGSQNELVSRIIQRYCEFHQNAIHDKLKTRVLTTLAKKNISDASRRSPYRLTLAVEAILGGDVDELGVWNIYKNYLTYYYKIHGLRNVWSNELYEKMIRILPQSSGIDSVEKVQALLSEEAYIFGGLLAITTFVDGIWASNVSVEAYNSPNTWVPNPAQRFSPNSSLQYILSLLPGESNIFFLLQNGLAPILFEMQPFATEVVKDGAFAFAHRSLHEHLIAASLLVLTPTVLLKTSEEVGDEWHGALLTRLSTVALEYPSILKLCAECVRVNQNLVDVLFAVVVDSPLSSLILSILVCHDHDALKNKSFKGLNLQSCNLTRAVLENTDFSEAILCGSTLRSAQIYGGNTFDNSDLSRVHLGAWPVMSGHVGGVKSISVSPCGTLLASGGLDRTVRIWDLTTFKELFCLNGHLKEVYCVSYSHDSKFVVSSAGDKMVYVWDGTRAPPDLSKIVKTKKETVSLRALVPTGVSTDEIEKMNPKMMWECKGHTRAVQAAHFSPNGQYIGSVSADGSVRLWNVTAREECAKVNKLKPNNLAWSKESNRIVVSMEEKCVVFAVPTLNVMFCVDGHAARITCASFANDGTCIATGSEDKRILLFDQTIGSPKDTPISAHTRTIRSLTYSPHATKIASAGDDNVVHIWDSQTRNRLMSFTSHEGPVNCVVFTYDGGRVVTACEDGLIRIFDVPAWTSKTTSKDGSDAAMLRVYHEISLNNVICDPPTLMVLKRVLPKVEKKLVTQHVDAKTSFVMKPSGSLALSQKATATNREPEAEVPKTENSDPPPDENTQ